MEVITLRAEHLNVNIKGYIMNSSIHQPLLNSITLAIFLCFTTSSIADGFSLKDAKTNKINKDKWLCKYCTVIPNSSAKITANLSNTKDNNGRFSTDIGDNSEGASGHVNADIDKREQGRHYQFLAQGVGKDNSNVELLASKKGSYKAILNYETLNQFGNGLALTPYTNPGDLSLELPPNWQRVATTSQMPSESFENFSKQVERESWRLAVDKKFAKNWQGYIDVKHQNKQGTNTTSGNILNKIVILPTGIDQNHLQFDVGSYFAYEYGTLLLNYYKSDFTNKRSKINWHSPYSVLFGGADGGQLSTAPDNQFDQISLFGNYHKNNLSLQARFNYGQLTQKESFLPYSNNPLLFTNTLPSNNLNGEVITLSSHIKVQYKTENKWKITLNYHVDDRDNNTQSNEYQQVYTDSVVLNEVSSNRPYSFNKTKVNLYSQYRFAIGSQLTFGWQTEQRERDFQDRNKTENEKYWFKVSTRFAPFNTISAEVSRELRDGSYYNRTVQTTQLSDELALQKYNQADREREQAKGRLSFSPFSNTGTNGLVNAEVSLQGYFSRDKYQKTDIGLIESKRHGFDVSLNTSFNKHLSLFIYTHKQWQDNISQGIYWFNHVDWVGSQNDKSDSTGITLVAEKLSDDKLTVGMDYSYSYAKGATQVNVPSLSRSDSHNELIVNSHDIKVYADYIYSTVLNLHINFLHQQFDEQDWRYEYDIDRIANVLGNNLSNYNYDAYRLTAGITYQF
jgi:MtrB/PioB family decaheme-associated outer membrane protein